MTKIKKIFSLWIIIFILFAFSAPTTEAINWNIGGCTGSFCFNWGSGTGTGTGAGWDPNNYGLFGLPGGSIIGILANLLLWLLAIFGVISIIGFVVAGIIYLTSAGSESRAEAAKKAMMYSIIGVVVGLSGFLILRAISFALQANTAQF